MCLLWMPCLDSGGIHLRGGLSLIAFLGRGHGMLTNRFCNQMIERAADQGSAEYAGRNGVFLEEFSSVFLLPVFIVATEVN